MSSFSGLFGDAPVDSDVSKIFAQASTKVEKPLRARTVIKTRKREAPSDLELDLEAGLEPELELDSPEAQPPKQARRERHDDDDIEGKYFQALQKEEDGSVLDTQTPTNARTPRVAAALKVDLKEAEFDKAERTVFVGNVPASAATSKAAQKALQKIFAAIGPVESVRFRSISFEETIPRKAAFAQKKLHLSRDSVNAYIVFKNKADSRKAIGLNGSVFEEHHLRVDHVAHPVAKDNRRTVFVGNLDFEAQEEQLWKHFNLHTDGDVESVRVVRDAKTNLGKGFALVQFKDTLSVNKALLLHDKPMNGTKRKLRVQRASTRAKPSVLSPNHADNTRAPRGPKQQLSEAQKSKLGRASAVLGRADRATIGKMKPVIEGQRARKGDMGKRKKKPRIRERTQTFKRQLQGPAP